MARNSSSALLRSLLRSPDETLVFFCFNLCSSLFFPLFLFSSSIFCSSSSSSASNFVVINSEQGFNSSLKKAQDDNLPAIFYFTAVWCPPCKLISPIIESLSKKYPHVMTFKVDIDQEEIRKKLEELNIMSVPTIHFFQNGKKADEMVGADVARLNQIVERLYSTKN
ncbi:thioredoxin O2, mitochondrial-like [Papaver somniferum]|uniref:thioredoxin O2, mitochondrial-like n=1 Tax=Papaver somniferum TaxID=3469 RepID=UPI000E70072D|nr:thioredoxin O2, mitochondrial-like [Papaver somniferum]